MVNNDTSVSQVYDHISFDPSVSKHMVQRILRKNLLDENEAFAAALLSGGLQNGSNAVQTPNFGGETKRVDYTNNICKGLFSTILCCLWLSYEADCT